ncbi:hypothetical protein HYV85_05885 [Candidatus Woesearchaeota archaeon]|nr:hypothetical protein [Candidatus Woesearchaeota archaeon]
MAERTIKPDWGKVLGKGPQPLKKPQEAGQDAGQQGQQAQTLPATHEDAVTAAASVATDYPLQLVIDVASHLYSLLKGKSLPAPQAVQDIAQVIKTFEEPTAYAHAILLVEKLGIESFTISNSVVKLPNDLQDSQRKKKQKTPLQDYFRVVSGTFANSVTAEKARVYVAALFGPDALNAHPANYLAQASLETKLALSSLPQLLPHMPETGFLQMFQKPLHSGPFNSEYYIVMAMQPPSTRLLVAKAIEATSGSQNLPASPPEIFPNDKFGTDYLPVAENRHFDNEFHSKVSLDALKSEGKKLGIKDTNKPVESYRAAWEKLHYQFQTAPYSSPVDIQG